jgi:hypothetical protein
MSVIPRRPRLARRGVEVVTTFAPSGVELPTLRVVGTLPHDRMKLLIEHADAYLATTKETFGIGTLEAMAAGVPVLGFDWGGTADLVQHQETGYLVKPGDMTGCARAGVHPGAPAAAGSSCTRGSPGHDWRTVMQQYAALYRRVAEPEPAGVTWSSPITTMARTLKMRSIVCCTRPTRSSLSTMGAPMAATHGSCMERTSTSRSSCRDNRGVAAARNAGIAAAEHPFIVCLDADDQARSDPTARPLQPHSKPIAVWVLPTLAWPCCILTSLYPRTPGRLTSRGRAQATPHNPPSNCIPSAAMFRKSDVGARRRL